MEKKAKVRIHWWTPQAILYNLYVMHPDYFATSLVAVGIVVLIILVLVV